MRAAVPLLPVEEKTEFSVGLTAVGANKINVIKAVREVAGLGLKEGENLVDGAPKPIKEGVTKDEAAALQKKFTNILTVEVKSLIVLRCLERTSQYLKESLVEFV